MKMYHAMNEDSRSHDPFRKLAAAVIQRAVADYRSLGVKLQEAGSPVERKHIEEQMKSISRFFLSDWYCMLSGRENGGEVLERLDREVFGDD